jgi:arginase
MGGLHLIALHSVDGTPPKGERYSGLAAAADAYLAGGIVDRLVAAGGQVELISEPSLDPSEIDADPIVNLGRLNAKIAAEVVDAVQANHAPVLLGGTCSHLIGMIAGMQQAYGQDLRLGLLWLDAHGDFNTPNTSYSGMLGGMPVAVAAGLCHPAWRELARQRAPLPANRIVMVDVRNLDDREEVLIRSTDVTIARFGENFDTAPIEAAIDRLAADCDLIYVHVDADILDASLQPNHPTAEPNGPDLDTVIRVLDYAFATGKASGFGVVSVNPTGAEGAISLASGTEMVIAGTKAWLTDRERRV